MFSFKLTCCVLLLALAALIGSGCASADKRFEQGWGLELQGQYESAVMRYVQALEKDPNLEEARTRLREVGDLAIAERFEEAEYLASQGDPVRSVSHFRRADGVVAKARSVGVRLALPVSYTQQRRGIFDEAFDALIASGIIAREQGRWENGVADFQQARRDFEPSRVQQNQALSEESTLLVQWSEQEYSRGHLRQSFAIAARVQELEWSPANLSARAAGYMEDCLAEGEVELIVLPIQVRPAPRQGRAHRYQIASQLETSLQEGPWRQPPAFIQVNSPLSVGSLINQAGLLNGEFNPASLAIILRLTDADYAAYFQLVSVESTEFEVRSKPQTVKTRDGQSRTFLREDGHRRIQATARVFIADDFGNQITDVIVYGTGTAPFSRGIYDGNPSELNLHRSQIDLFDRFVLEAQEQAAHDALVRDLAINMAGAVFQPTLAQIP